MCARVAHTRSLEKDWNQIKMTESEKQDLAIMKTEIDRLKINAFDTCLHTSGLSSEELAACGYRNGIGNAMLDIIKRSNIRITKLTNDHVRKYPD